MKCRTLSLILLYGIFNCGRAAGDESKLHADSFSFQASPMNHQGKLMHRRRPRRWMFAWQGSRPPENKATRIEDRLDVSLMHRVFSQYGGGVTTNEVLFDDFAADKQGILDLWQRAVNLVGPSDSYLQYSSSHGREEGLVAADDTPINPRIFSWEEVRDHILEIPAKEVIIIVMACNSGALIDAFRALDQDELRRRYANRTLFILASSAADEASFAGPTDTNHPIAAAAGERAGSEFTYHLWQGLRGLADTASWSNTDQFVTFDEIARYLQENVRKQTPQVFGFYDPDQVLAPVGASLPPIGRGESFILERLEAAISNLKSELVPLEEGISEDSFIQQDASFRLTSLLGPNDAWQFSSLELDGWILQADLFAAQTDYLTAAHQRGCMLPEGLPRRTPVVDDFDCTSQDIAELDELKQKVEDIHQRFYETLNAQLEILEPIEGSDPDAFALFEGSSLRLWEGIDAQTIKSNQVELLGEAEVQAVNAALKRRMGLR